MDVFPGPSLNFNPKCASTTIIPPTERDACREEIVIQKLSIGNVKIGERCSDHSGEIILRWHQDAVENAPCLTPHRIFRSGDHVVDSAGNFSLEFHVGEVGSRSSYFGVRELLPYGIFGETIQRAEERDAGSEQRQDSESTMGFHVRRPSNRGGVLPVKKIGVLWDSI